MEPDAVAIAPGLARVRRDRGQVAQACARQGFKQDVALDRELQRVACMLILAASACAVVGARRGNAFGGRGEYLDEIGFGEAAFVAAHRGFDFFAGQAAWNKNGFAVVTSQARAAVDCLFYAEFHPSLRM